MIMIIYRYTLSRKSYMENPDKSEWVPICLCENLRLFSPKESVTDLSDLIVIWGVIVVLWYIPTLCLLGCRLVFLGIIPVLWWYRPRLAPDRGVSPSTTGTLLCFWPHSSLSLMWGTPCLTGVRSCRCAVSHAVSCKTWCPPSSGCLFVYSPLWGLCSTHIIACRRKLFRDYLSNAYSQVVVIFPVNV